VQRQEPRERDFFVLYDNSGYCSANTLGMQEYMTFVCLYM